MRAGSRACELMQEEQAERALLVLRAAQVDAEQLSSLSANLSA